MLWIGNGKPRRFCPPCRTSIECRQLPEYEVHASGLNLSNAS